MKSQPSTVSIEAFQSTEALQANQDSLENFLSLFVASDDVDGWLDRSARTNSKLPLSFAGHDGID